MADALLAECMGVPGRDLAMARLRPAPAMAPCQQLAVAVIEQLVADLRGSERTVRADARACVDAGSLEDWMTSLDLSASVEALICAGVHALAHQQGTVPRVPLTRRRVPGGGY